MTDTPFDIQTILPDMDGGVFLEKISRAVQDTALGVVVHGDKGKKGKVTIELTFERIGESMQVQCRHKLVYSRPTRRGKASEEDTTETPFYVDNRGRLSIVPHEQMDFLKDETREDA